MLRALRVVLILALLIPPYRPVFAQAPDASPDSTAQPPQDKEAKMKQLVDLLKSFSNNDYKAAVEQSGVDAAARPELASRDAALKTGYTTLAAMEYHNAAKAAPDGSKYQKAYKHVIEDDAAAVAVNPETMQETGRFWDIMKIAGKVALKYGLTAAIMAVGNEIKSPEEQERANAISRFEGELASAGIAPDQAAEAHYQLGSTYEQAAAAIDVDISAQAGQQPEVQVQVEAPVELNEKQRRLAQIANFLQSISDKDYKGALAQAIPFIPTKGQRPPLLVSRSAALQSTYDSMAALQYEQANQQAPSDKYAEAYQRAASQDAAAASIDGQNLEQTGLAMDIFKFLGNAAINYELGGGQVYVGRQVRTPEQRKLDKKIGDYEAQLAGGGLPPETEASIRYKLGLAYEERAKAAAAPEAKDELVAKKKARIKKLASLLQTVSDDDYQTAMKRAGVEKTGGPDMTSKPAALKSAYTTLAGLEYHQASSDAPNQTSYSTDYKRVAGDDAQNLAINPDTLQETGWFTNLLGVAALGGIGYLVYDQAQKHRHNNQPAPPPPVACPAGTTLTNGRCQPPLSCPTGYALTTDGGCMARDFECPEKTAKVGNVCMAACPVGTTQLADGRCRLELTCPAGTTKADDRCVGAPICPSGSKLVGGECVIVDVACPAGSSKGANGGCAANFHCPAQTALVGDNCVASCPSGTVKRADGSCQIDMTCPAGTTMSGNTCLGTPVCPFGWQLSGTSCVGSPICPPGSNLSSGQCVIAGTTCPAGSHMVGSQCVVSDVSCPAGSHLQAAVWSQCPPCSPAPAPGGVPVVVQCHPCDPALVKPAGCVADNWTCPAGTQKNGSSCVAACPAATTRAADGSCQPSMTCPAGTALATVWPFGRPVACDPMLVNGKPVGCPGPSLKCMGTPICPPNSKLTGGRCVFTNVECPSGSRLDADGDCLIANVECPAGTMRVGSSCAAPCPSGTTTLPNGSCQLATVCAAGSTLVNGRCLGDLLCQAPAQLTGGQCLLPPPRCPMHTTMIANRCRPACPPGAKLVDDRCQPVGGPPVSTAFTPSVVVSPGDGSSTAAEGHQTMARDSKGNLYFAYLKGYKGHRRVFVGRSTNNGASWQDTTTIPVETTGDVGPGLDQGSPSLAVDSHDVLHLAWGGANSQLDRVGGIETKMMYAEAPAPGSAWSPAVKIPGAPYEGWEGSAQILVDSKDGLHLVWAGQDNGANPGWRVRYSYRPSGSKTWSPYYNVGAQDGAAAFGAGAALDSNDVLHVIAQHQMNAADSIVYASRSAAGAWSAWQKLSAAPAAWPAMAVDARNNVHAVWTANDGHVSYARRDAAAGSWSVNPGFQPATGGGSDRPALAVDAAGNVFVAWATWATTAGQPSAIHVSQFSGKWTAWSPVSVTASNQRFPTLRWSQRNENGGVLGVGWTEIDANGGATVRYAQNPYVSMAGGAPLRYKPLGIGAPVAVGRSVGGSDSIEVLEEGLADDDLTPDKGAALHHQLGAAYEKLAMSAAPAKPWAEEARPSKKPSEQPAAKPKAKEKAKPKVEEPPAEDEAEEAQPPRRHVPTAEEQRQADEKDLDDMGKKMSDEVQKRTAPAPSNGL